MNADISSNAPYTNREISWLEFNSRVQYEATRRTNPLMERMKFLAIVQSNLDEFYMVRVGTLVKQVRESSKHTDDAGMTADQQLSAISPRVHEMMKRQYDIWRHGVMPELRRNGIDILKLEKLTSKQRDEITSRFEREIFPVLTPLAVDGARPFPLISSRSLNVAVLLHQADDLDGPARFATVQIPAGLDRLQLVQSEDGQRAYVLLEHIVEKFLPRLFRGCKIITSCFYRATRNSDYMLDEEDVDDLVDEVRRTLNEHRTSYVVRLEVNKGADSRLLDYLISSFQVDERAVFKLAGPLNLDFLWSVYSWPGYDNLKYPPFTPRTPEWFDGEESICEAIARSDRYLHHPYHSFDPVVAFVKQAASDPRVLAIKQTLYRVGKNSPIVAALAEAARFGKQVTVLLEVKARFDEENNITWGKWLEEAGAHVIYGIMGLKTHSKITLVVRAEDDGIRRYVHLGTGNYNPSTARLYTDMGLLTADEDIGEDASAFFNMVTGYSEPVAMHSLIPAPNALRKRFIALIQQETEHARNGRPAGILAKMNSLVDIGIINALYEASQAGVPVRLVVRGICCLRPGLPGISENIEVHSIVGRFLEHVRAFHFEGGGRPTLWLSSADWMPRNLDRRIELLFPIRNGDICGEIRSVLELQWNDNCQAHRLLPDGTYERITRRGKIAVDSQQTLAYE